MLKSTLFSSLSLIALLFISPVIGQAQSISGCSVAGTASTTKDSVCVNGITTLVLTGYFGGIQWQSYDGTQWVNEIGVGSTTDNYTVTLLTSTDFRAIVTEIGCPSDISNTISIVVGVTPPATQGETRCGYGSVTLNALGNGVFKWYDSPSSTNPLYIGNNFTTTVSSTTTFYCAAASSSGGSGTTPMPAQATIFSSNARGYFFTAPTDFTITGLYVPEPTNGTTQNIALVRFVPAVPPPFYATVTNDFNVLFLTQNDPSTSVIPVNIPIAAGDVIGVLGTRGAGDVNSYANSPATTVINGQTITIERMGMQFPLATTSPIDLWQEAGGNISRVEITYETGCESARTATVATVTTPTAITLSANPPALCEGQTTTLAVSSANSGYSYTWSPATGLSGTTGNSVTATPLSPITYTVIADDGTCANIDSVFISVGPASVAGTASISTDTICLGSNSTLFLAGNTGSIQWQSFDGTQWNNETGPGNNTNTYLVSPTSFTEYRAVVTSGGCASATSGTVSLEVIAITDPTTVNDTICGPGTVNLLSNGAGVMNWFANATGGNTLFTGSNYTPSLSNTTTYFVEASAGGTYNVGAPNPGIGTQFALPGNDWGLQFDVTQQVSLDKVYISPGATSGPVTINLRTAQGGTILNTVTANVIAFSGLQPINIGWTINPGTGYRLEMDASSVQCYYNSFGAVYPYTFAGSSVAITGSINPTFSAGTFYYFFYNLEFTEGCKSNRVPVTGVVNPAITTPTISQNGTILTSSSATGNQWYLNGAAIPGATGNTYDMALSGSGSYTVMVSDGTTGCSAESIPVIYTGIQDLASAGIYVYPNPVSENLTIEFVNALKSKTQITVYNKLGEVVYSEMMHNNKKIIPMNFAPGTYAVELKSDGAVYSTRVLKL
jgi:hypothetical protein